MPINHRKQRAWPRLLIHCGGDDNSRGGPGERKRAQSKLIIQNRATLVDYSPRRSLVSLDHVVGSKQ